MFSWDFVPFSRACLRHPPSTMFRPSLRRLAAEISSTGNIGCSSTPAAELLPPLVLYRRLLRVHRKVLPRELRVMGDEYVKVRSLHYTARAPMGITGRPSPPDRHFIRISLPHQSDSPFNTSRLTRLTCARLVVPHWPLLLTPTMAPLPAFTLLRDVSTTSAFASTTLLSSTRPSSVALVPPTTHCTSLAFWENGENTSSTFAFSLQSRLAISGVVRAFWSRLVARDDVAVQAQPLMRSG